MTSEYASWRPEPDGRGTWSILSSCVITLVLCVYTAVHLNVPAVSETRADRCLSLTIWVLLGIFAPELVAWTAWGQWREAKWLSKKIDDMRSELADTEKSSGESGHNLSAIAPLISSWTLKHSYFVAMGGIQLQPADVACLPRLGKRWHHRVLPYRRLPRSVFTTHGFLAFLEAGHGGTIPVFSEGDIDDKSKADGLAKVLSCLQGSWILIQIIGRVASHQAITQLEINTLAHVVCAFAMYVFWWNKPLKVEQPVLLKNDEIAPWTRICSGLSRQGRYWVTCRKIGDHSATRQELHAHAELQGVLDCERCPRFGGYGLILRHDVLMSAEQVVEMLKRGAGYPICDFVAVAPASDEYLNPMLPSQIGSWLDVNQSELDTLLQIHAESPGLWSAESYPRLEGEMELGTVSYMVKSDHAGSIGSVGVTTLLSSLYGALHASLWQHHVPTIVEMRMWRISCLVVAGGGLLLALLAGGVELNYFLRQYRQLQVVDKSLQQRGQFWRKIATVLDRVMIRTIGRLHKRVLSGLGYGLLGVICVVTGAVVFCRIFLVVEAFISLRSQPESVYQTPNWTQWLPHL